jgi:NADPH-dependent 2,4-dienoyl-CoA reductase/sulfur reductase-like enzyme
VHRLRTLADSKAIIAKAQRVRSYAVIGSGFIGLEVAASLRQRGLPVSVIGQESVPLSKILGVELGRYIRNCTSSTGSVSS